MTNKCFNCECKVVDCDGKCEENAQKESSHSPPCSISVVPTKAQKRKIDEHLQNGYAEPEAAVFFMHKIGVGTVAIDSFGNVQKRN